MKGTRSFRGSNRTRKNRTRGGKQPRVTGSRMSSMRSRSVAHHTAKGSTEVGNTFINALAFLLAAIYIFTTINNIQKPFSPFSPSVHFSQNSFNHNGPMHVAKSLPSIRELKDVNLMKSPSFMKISNHAVGSTPSEFVSALGIQSKFRTTGTGYGYNKRMDFLPTKMHYTHVFEILDLGPTSTIKELIEKIVEKSEGDKKKEIKDALLLADDMVRRTDIMSDSRMATGRKSASRGKSASRSK